MLGDMGLTVYQGLSDLQYVRGYGACGMSGDMGCILCKRIWDLQYVRGYGAYSMSGDGLAL